MKSWSIAKFWFVALAASAGLPLAASAARAHAFLDHAVPAVGSETHDPPAQISLWFTQDLEPAFVTLRVTDGSGNRADRNDAQLDSADPTLLHETLTPLPPGVYKVTWRVVSRDTHVTDGDFSFTVLPGAGSP